MVRERHHNAAEHRKELAQAINNISGGLTAATGSTSTGSSTSLTVTGIASGANQVILMFHQVTNADTGDTHCPTITPNNVSVFSGGVATHIGSALQVTDGTSKIYLNPQGASSPHQWNANQTLHGQIMFHRITANQWVYSGAAQDLNDTEVDTYAGRFSLGANELASFTLTTDAGTSAFGSTTQIEAWYQ
jgi:hypothetical protein